MQAVLLFKPEYFMALYNKGFEGWMSMASGLGLMYHFVLIFIGLAICYFGFKFYRILIISFGAMAGAFAGLLIVDNLGISGTGASLIPNDAAFGAWDFIAFLFGMILGGTVSWWLSWVAVFIFSFIGVSFLAFFAINPVIHGPVAIGLSAGIGLIGAAACVRIFKPFMIIITALLGAFDFAMGVAGVLVATGVVTVLTDNEAAGLWAFILPFVLMTILGLVNQVLDNYKEHFEPDNKPSAEIPAPV